MGKMDGLLEEAEYGDEFEHSHFCVKCMKEIERFIQKMPTTEPAATEEPEGSSDGAGQKASKKGRVRLDMGKVMALRKAGWSLKDIADEMKAHPQSVSNAIRRHMKNGGAVMEG